jgi:hypothetical protein
MGLGGGVVVGGIFVVTILYGCGPNVIIGTVGAAITGGAALSDKVKKVYLENQLNNNPTEAESQDLTARIQALDESQQKNLNRCSLFLWSIIPIVGPVIAMSKST